MRMWQMIGAGIVVIAAGILAWPEPPAPSLPIAAPAPAIDTALPVEVVEQAPCETPLRFSPEEEPFLTAEDIPWQASTVSCMNIVDLPAALGGGRIAWFKYIDKPNDTNGFGRAVWRGDHWRVDPQPALDLVMLAEDGITQIGCVTTLTESDGLRLWFRVNDADGMRTIYQATSDGITISVPEDNPVLEADESWMKNHLWSPSVLREADGYRMYLRCGKRRLSTLCMATSSDGIRWRMHPEKLVRAQEMWRSEVLGDPQVIEDDGLYYLWFSHAWFPGFTDPESGDEIMLSELALVVSDRPDWFDLKSAAVVMRPGAEDWMSNIVDDPVVTLEAGRWILYFRGARQGSGRDGALGRAEGDCTGAPSYGRLRRPDQDTPVDRWGARWIKHQRKKAQRDTG